MRRLFLLLIHSRRLFLFLIHSRLAALQLLTPNLTDTVVKVASDVIMVPHGGGGLPASSDPSTPLSCSTLSFVPV